MKVNSTTGTPYTKKQLQEVEKLAKLGVPQRICADYLGVEKSTFNSHLRVYPKLRMLYFKAAGQAKKELINIAYTMATEGKKKNTAMIIFLLKSVCGFREYSKDTQEDVDTKAQIARQTLEQMNAGLEKFQARDGGFKDSEEEKPKKKSSAQSTKSSVRGKKKARK